MTRQGLFIAFEDVDYSGKSTACKSFCKALRTTGANVLETREVGGTPFAERARALLLASPDIAPLTQALLISAARSDHLLKVILPSINIGTHVVTDRYHISTAVYQQESPSIDAIVRHGDMGIVPNITFILDIDYPTFTARSSKRQSGNDYKDVQTEEEFELKRSIYKAAHLRDTHRIALVDARGNVYETLERVIKAYDYLSGVIKVYKNTEILHMPV